MKSAANAFSELLAGFQAAGDAELAREDPRHVRDGLVTTVLRLAFLLYAEGRGLIDPTVSDLSERSPDWPRLLAIFRRVHARGGKLFDPTAFPFLARRRVPDGTIARVLEHLLVENGAWIDFGALEVERLGSVYEALMDFELEVAAGSLTLRPGEERRRSGAHYTPRELVLPIVRTTLRPVLEELGARPTPEAVLALSVCDPAMGSGAFLLEACRQLAERLVEAWEEHGVPPEAAGDELARARGLVARRCLYGVDKDPFAVSLAKLSLWLATGARAQPFTFLDHALRCGDSLVGHSGEQGPPSVRAFTWEREFPKVFRRDPPGFDAVVGNPPFLGGRNISGSLGKDYLAYLTTAFPESGGQADLVTYFFRRAFELIRPGGAFGLLATNTIAQGDSRAAGLRWIREHGGSIFAATRRLPWPGAAAVTVSAVHVMKGEPRPGTAVLDGKPCARITAYLSSHGPDDDPNRLAETEGLGFSGLYIYGPGFKFEDGDDGCTPLAQMQALIAKEPRNAERIFPYLGGQEMLEDPRHRHKSFVIDFGDLAEEEARAWPDLMTIVEEKVRPSRRSNNRESRRRLWWQYGENRPGLRRAMARVERVLMHPFTASHLAFAFVPTTTYIASPHCVFALEGFAGFCVLQSRVHEVWVRFFASTLEDRLRYTISDCFRTFAFPEDWRADPRLEDAGRAYYEYRAELMVRNGEGLTKTYNRLHDPDEREPGIAKLRALHAAMDRAVLDAYGWRDVPEGCEFLLDYETDGEESRRRRKKPWRLRWPDAVRDELLGRLLGLNQQRR